MKKFLALTLALCVALSLSVTAFAAEIDDDGGSGSTPVYLSSTQDGTIYLLLVCLVVMTALPAIALADSGTDEHIHTDKDADTEKNEDLSTDSAVASENAPEVEDNTTDDAGEAETNIPSSSSSTGV